MSTSLPPPQSARSPPRSVLVDRWWLRQPQGEPYGPVPKVELDRWYADGRISPQCQVLCEPEQAWRWAADVYPALLAPPVFVPPSPFAHGVAPGAGPPPPAPGPASNPMVVVVAVVDLLMGLFSVAYSVLMILRSLPVLVLINVIDRPHPEMQWMETASVACLVLGVVGMIAGILTLVCAYGTSLKRRWGRWANYSLAAYFFLAAIVHAVFNGPFHIMAACLLFVVSIGFGLFVSIVLTVPAVAKEFDQ